MMLFSFHSFRVKIYILIQHSEQALKLLKEGETGISLYIPLMNQSTTLFCTPELTLGNCMAEDVLWVNVFENFVFILQIVHALSIG